MAKEYLDKAGLTYFWGKIKTYVTNAVKVTGVKGNSESSYRTGNVNLTPANIGAVPTTRTVNGYALSANVNIGAEDIDSIGIATGGNHLTLADDLDALDENVNSKPDYSFSKITVGTTTIEADGKADTLTLVAGSNVSLTPDATNDKITIGFNGGSSSVTGVKGNSESSYRTGNVNLTPANIGAVPTASIASGTISSTSVSANSYKDVTVSFGKTFSSAPHVVVGLNSTSTAGKIGLVSVAVYSVSTTQFVARFFNGDTTSRAPAAYWIAMAA